MKRFILTISLIFVFLPTLCQTTIVMEKKGDVYYIPGEINGVPLKFIFDTGASNVYLSLTEALFMLKNGYLSDQDFGNTTYSQIANGDIVENTEVLLKEIKIGPIVINNVKAMVSNTISAPLLLGQSAIQKLGPIQLDGNKLIVSTNKNMLPSNETALNYYQKAFQFSEAGEYEEAIKMANEALKLTNENKLRASIYITLAHSYSNMGEIDKAISSLNNALSEDITNATALYNLGFCLYEKGDLLKAIKNFNSLVNLTQSQINKTMLANAYYYLGECNVRLKNTTEAENAFKKSLEFESNPFANLSLGNLYFDENQFNKAIPYFKKLVSIAPNKLSSMEIWHKLGLCYVQNDQISDALEAFHNCMGIAKDNSNLILGGQWDEKDAFMYKHLPLDAELWIARISEDPNLSIKYYDGLNEFLGDANNFTPLDYITWAEAVEDVYNPMTKIDKLNEIFKLAQKKFHDNPDILFYYSHLKGDNDPDKLDLLYKILQQEFNYRPMTFDYATVYNNIAWALHLNNRSAEGLPYAESAVKKNAKLDYSWETLGEIYFALGRYQDVIDAMTRCIDLSGDSKKEAYECRAKAYQKLGKKKEAKCDSEIARQL